MATYNWTAIYLGNAADMDPDDANFTAENAGDILGTYGSAGDPLYDNQVNVQVNDADDDTNVNYDDPSETMTIDGVAHTLDSGAVYNATITYTDGTTATITAVVMQTSDGDLYLAPEMSQNADFFAMQDKAIQSLTLDSVNTGTTTVGADRQSTAFVCIAAGASIATADGEIPVERLRRGDRVRTLDHGLQPVRWICARRAGLGRQLADGRAVPIRIEAGALGNGRPRRALYLSQQHRVLLRSPVAGRMFASQEVLVAAKKLLGRPGIALAPVTAIRDYFHIVCDRHEVILADGAPVETLLLAGETRRILGDETFGNILDARSADGSLALADTPARPILRGRRIEGFLLREQARLTRRGAHR